MSPWYADGLRFACTACGNCCTGTPGYVWVSPREQKAIARHLGLSLADFRRRHTRLVGTNLSLTEAPGGACVFLSAERRCAIQDVKPRQCLTFPFWPRIVASRVSWKEQTWTGNGRGCPGMDRGPLFLPEEIETLVDPETPREVLLRIFSRKPS